MASIQEKNGTYYLVWRENGRYRWKKASKDKKTANLILDNFNVQHDRQAWGLPPKTSKSYLQAKERFLAERATIKSSGVDKSAFRDFENHLSPRSIADLNPRAINKYYIQEITNRNPEGVKRYFTVLRRFGRRLVKWGYCASNPFDDDELVITSRRNAREVKHLSDEQIKEYFSVAWGNYAVFGMAGLFTGGRPGEILMLQVRDIDTINDKVFFTDKPEHGWTLKTHQKRSVRLLPPFKEFFVKNFSKAKMTDFLIPGPIKEKPFRYNMTKFIKPKVNIPHLVPYVFRHTFAINVLRELNDIYALSKILGHRSVRTTEEHYAVYLENEKEKKLDTLDYGKIIRTALENPLKTNPQSHHKKH